MPTNNNTLQADAIVIGTGIAGAMTAHKLASKGRKVLVIERGIRLSPELIRETFESESFMGNPKIPSLSIDFAGDKTRSRPIPAVAGGLARVYSGVSLRMREKEFDAWPFSYSDIEPYYTQAEGLMNISGASGVDPCEPPRSAPYPLKVPTMSGYSERLSNGAKKLGLKPFQHPFAIDFDEGCVRCNHCNQVPCLYESKWNPDTFLARNEGENIEVRSELEATKIIWNKDGSDYRIEGIEATDLRTGTTLTLRGNNYVLAGGAILTPKLMLQSGMETHSPLIGRHLMMHCLALVVGFFPFRMSAEGDFHKWWSISDFYFDDEGKVRGMIQQDHLTARKKIFGKIPRIIHPFVSLGYYNTCQLLVVAEDDPVYENRIALDPNGGPSGILLHHSFTSNDEARRKFLAKQAKRIMRKTGALLALAFNGKSIYHSCGTCRMGASPSDSVTDPNGRVWGTKNLYVADASIFPTSSGVNPSLSIAANALKVADGIQ